VTDKLCRRVFVRLAKKLETEYEGHFPYVSAGDAFFDRLNHVEAKLHQALEQRPLTRAEIDSLELRAFKALRATMVKVAKTVTQPQFREAIDLETGKTRLIPEYD
jgi:hypothetical protein